MYPYYKPLLFFLTFRKYFNIGVSIEYFGKIDGQKLFMNFYNIHNRNVLDFYSNLTPIEKNKLVQWYNSLVPNNQINNVEMSSVDESIDFFTSFEDLLSHKSSPEFAQLYYKFKYNYASDPILFYLKLDNNKKLNLFQSKK